MQATQPARLGGTNACTGLAIVSAKMELRFIVDVLSVRNDTVQTEILVPGGSQFQGKVVAFFEEWCIVNIL